MKTGNRKSKRGMKRFSLIVALVLTLLLLLSCCACAKPPEQPAGPETGPGAEPGDQPEEQAENSGVEGGNFAEHDELIAALTAPGNTTVTLTQDETVDLTGIELEGRKEIILNDFTLTLTGQYGVTGASVLDIKPGEELTEGVIDMSALQFDLSNVPTGAGGELALIEIRPGIAISEPRYGEGVEIREFPGILTVIEYAPVQ